MRPCVRASVRLACTWLHPQEVTEPACEETAALLWQRLGKNKKKRADDKKRREKENRVAAKQGVDSGNVKRQGGRGQGQGQGQAKPAVVKKNPGPALEVNFYTNTCIQLCHPPPSREMLSTCTLWSPTTHRPPRVAHLSLV